MSDTRISVSGTLDAPVERVFALLADPDRHPDLDGSGMLVASHSHLALTELGDVFVMEMERPDVGRYTVENHVVRYEPDRALAWAPASPGEDPPGVVWTWELAPATGPGGADHTVATHTYDWSAVTDPELLALLPSVSAEQMQVTIERLAEALA